MQATSSCRGAGVLLGPGMPQQHCQMHLWTPMRSQRRLQLLPAHPTSLAIHSRTTARCLPCRLGHSVQAGRSSSRMLVHQGSRLKQCLRMQIIRSCQEGQVARGSVLQSWRTLRQAHQPARAARSLPRRHCSTSAVGLCTQTQPGTAGSQGPQSQMQQHRQSQLGQCHLPSKQQPRSAHAAPAQLPAGPAGPRSLPQVASSAPAALLHHLQSPRLPSQADAAPAMASLLCPQVGIRLA